MTDDMHDTTMNIQSMNRSSLGNSNSKKCIASLTTRLKVSSTSIPSYWW